MERVLEFSKRSSFGSWVFYWHSQWASKTVHFFFRCWFSVSIFVDLRNLNVIVVRLFNDLWFFMLWSSAQWPIVSESKFGSSVVTHRSISPTAQIFDIEVAIMNASSSPKVHNVYAARAQNSWGRLLLQGPWSVWSDWIRFEMAQRFLCLHESRSRVK